MAGKIYARAGLLSIGLLAQTGLPAALAGTAPASAPAYDFAYRLSGDRRVAPIQVFDDGRTTWLQFQPGQTIPAIFAGTGSGGGQLASYTQQGPYIVLNGTVASWSLRIGAIAAQADYVGQATRLGLASPAPAIPSQWADEGGAAPVQTALPASTSAARMPLPALPEAPPPRPAPAAAMAREASVLEFDVSLSDANMRTALSRWARQAGWMFDAEHWTVDVDIPLAGVAAFGADFRHAVRTLLASTELADKPLQPCFYSNRVLRVVPLSHACDRTAAPLRDAPAQS